MEDEREMEAEKERGGERDKGGEREMERERWRRTKRDINQHYRNIAYISISKRA
jgi:hypothetical protein